MGIEKVVFNSKEDFHENENRKIIGMLNNTEFEWKRTRTVKVVRDCELGGHYRDYPEEYGVIGSARFFLEDIETKEKKLYELKDGQTIFIPPRVALKIEALKDTVITVCFPDVDMTAHTHKYQIA